MRGDVAKRSLGRGETVPRLFLLAGLRCDATILAKLDPGFRPITFTRAAMVPGSPALFILSHQDALLTALKAHNGVVSIVAASLIADKRGLECVRTNYPASRPIHYISQTPGRRLHGRRPLYDAPVGFALSIPPVAPKAHWLGDYIRRRNTLPGAGFSDKPLSPAASRGAKMKPRFPKRRGFASRLVALSRRYYIEELDPQRVHGRSSYNA